MSVGLILKLFNEHNIILFNEFNKFSDEPARIKYSIYQMPFKNLLIVKKYHFALARLY